MDTIPARELDRYVQDESCLILDLRRRSEFARGHIRGAVNVPDGRFGDILSGKEGSTLIFYCERGARSMAAARDLERRGWNTKTVVGGIRAYRGPNMVRNRAPG